MSVPGYDGPSLPETPGPLPVDELGAAFQSILCHALIECEGAAYPDVSACTADREPQGLQDILDGVQDGSIGYDAEAMGECRRLFEANLCALAGGFLFVPSVPEIVQLCLATRGRRAEGEACRSGLECRRGSFCDRETSCPGACRALRSVGDACSESEQCAPLTEPPELTLAEFLQRGEELARALAASSVSCVGMVCTAPIARLGSGEPCTDEDQCSEELWCDLAAQQSSTADAPGTCRPRSEPGGPCANSSHCQAGLRCLERDAQGRGRCGRRSASGSPCEAARDCQDGLGCVERRCAALPAEGAPCAAGDRCARGFACSPASICSELVLPGDACDEAARLCVGICRAGSCEGRAALGAACTEANECTSRACDGQRCYDDELCANAQL